MQLQSRCPLFGSDLSFLTVICFEVSIFLTSSDRSKACAQQNQNEWIGQITKNDVYIRAWYFSFTLQHRSVHKTFLEVKSKKYVEVMQFSCFIPHIYHNVMGTEILVTQDWIGVGVIRHFSTCRLYMAVSFHGWKNLCSWSEPATFR